MRFCWAQYSLWAVIIVLATLSMLAGCGAKGDLFLPPEEKAALQPATSPVAESEPAQPQLEAQPQ
jgi:predicted small lipoprotein YifL